MLFIEALLIGIISVVVPGFLLALALLHRTGMNKLFIFLIGIAFGLIFPPSMIWLESYLIPISPAFAFSAGLYDINVAILSIIGFILSVQQGAFHGFQGITQGNKKEQSFKETVEEDYRKRIKELRSRIAAMELDLKMVRAHEKDEEYLFQKHAEELHMLKSIGPEEKKSIEEKHAKEEKRLYEEHESEEKLLLGNNAAGERNGAHNKMNYIYAGLIVLMLITFLTRIANIAVSPTYFEFDPYYDMISAQYILVHGYQLLYDNAAWPGFLSNSIHRIQPLIPYLESYWYSISNANPALHYVDTNLLSIVSSYYPPITAALLVFAVFIFLYYEYGKMPALLGAGLATFMPALITTFIAGEQLLEPWGIFAMFFFYATYLLAINNPKEHRYAILAGIAFASNFLGAHYYTVTTGVLGIYILLQGVLNVLRNKDNIDFYKMNAILIVIIAISYMLYGLYGATLTERTPSILGIPIVISIPLVALIFVAILERLPKLAVDRNLIKKANTLTYAELLAAMIIIGILLVAFTPIGTPFQKYIELSVHFTTPSIPLFMTVQEYAPTGFNFNFGAAGFGLIGASVLGISILVWGVLILFTALEAYAIYSRDSRSSVLSLAIVLPLAIAGMSEIKYLPHFGVGYIIAICSILGELMLIYGNFGKFYWKNPVFIAAGIIFLAEFLLVTPALVSAISNPNCATINSQGNSIGAEMYCNQVPGYWINATDWMKQNVGPYAPRVLSWWDYGDWINWFGNSNAVLRGDNAVAKLDYATAAQYVFGNNDGYNSTELRNFMNGNQSGYILMDNQLVPKWGALDFLACINTNQTSMQYAISQGAKVGAPYQLGTSPCELSHDPAFIYIAINQNINNYCQFGNSTNEALKGILVVGNSPLNQTYCVPIRFLQNGNYTYLYNTNGSRTNLMLASEPVLFGGASNISGQTFISFMVLVAPNGPNGTITDAPSLFYQSNFYKGFFLGHLNGFTLAYPSNFTGMNYINSTDEIMIYKLDNFTGSLPNVTVKASWVSNNYIMPG